MYQNEGKTFELTNVKAEEVKIGDVFDANFDDHEVLQKTKKTAWVHLLLTNGSARKYRIGESVDVWRETEESKNARIDAEYRARRNKQIQEWFDNYEERKATKAIQAKINEQLSHDGALIDDWTMASFIQAQAEDKVSARLHRAVRVFQERTLTGEDFPGADDLVGVAELISERFKEELIQFRGLSRSTSVVSNVMEDADREAQARFVGRGSYGGWFI